MDPIAAKLLETILTVLLGIETNLISGRIERGASKREIDQDLRTAIRSKIAVAQNRADLMGLTQRCISEALQVLAAAKSSVPDRFFKALVEDQRLLDGLTKCVLCGDGEDRQLALDVCKESLSSTLTASSTPQEEADAIFASFIEYFDNAITFNDDLVRLRTVRFQSDTTETLRHIQQTLVSMSGVPLSAPMQRMYVLARNTDFDWGPQGSSLLLESPISQPISQTDSISLHVVTAFRPEFVFPAARTWPAIYVLARLLNFFGVLEPFNTFSYGLIDLRGSRNRAAFGDRMMRLDRTLEELHISDGSDIAIAYLPAGEHMLFME